MKKMKIISLPIGLKNCLMEHSGNFTSFSQCVNISEHQYCSCRRGKGRYKEKGRGMDAAFPDGNDISPRNRDYVW